MAFLSVVAALAIFFFRRRQPTENNKRWTFHRDKMVLPPVLDIRRVSPMNTEFYSPDDIEQQALPHDDDDDDSDIMIPTSSSSLPRSPIVIVASPSGPRPLLKPKSPHRPLPLPPLPLKPHQKSVVGQMEQIRKKMIELEKNSGPTQHIIMDDLQKQMNWLKSQL